MNNIAQSHTRNLEATVLRSGANPRECDVAHCPGDDARPIFLAMHPRKLLALALPALVACGGISGSGVAKTETRSVGSYDSVEVHGALDVEITVGPASSLAVTADDNLLSHVETDVVGDELVIRPKGTIRPNTPIEVIITTPVLEGIEVHGASDAVVTGLSAERFEATVHGASDLSLKGKADALEVEAHGASVVDAEDLVAKHADVDAAGASKVTLSELEELDANLSGASHCTYAGDPAIDESLSGASSLKKR